MVCSAQRRIAHRCSTSLPLRHDAMLTMLRFIRYVIVSGVAVSLQPVLRMEGAEMTIQGLFDAAISARGAEYAAIRGQLLAAPADAKAFLTNVAPTHANAETRWLAETLLARLGNPDEFARLEKELDAKVRLVKLGYPNRTPLSSPLTRADLWIGIRLPDEAVPDRTNAGRDVSPEVKEFHQAARLSTSEQWKPFLGEVLLKGWSPTAVPRVAEPKPLAEQTLDDNGIPRDRKPMLASDDHLRQAILLLGKFGEQRAVPRIADLLMDKSQDGRTRVLAARALGYLKSDQSLETLLRLVEDEQTAPWVRIESFGALARLKDERAAPALERMIANLDDTSLPGDLGPQRWKREARSALMRIRGQ
jgi:hypothetical protein